MPCRRRAGRRFASSGEITPPCGVPRRVRCAAPRPPASRPSRSTTTGRAQPLSVSSRSDVPVCVTRGPPPPAAGHGGSSRSRPSGRRRAPACSPAARWARISSTAWCALFLRAEAVGARLEVRLEDRLQAPGGPRLWTTRSRTVGMPSGPLAPTPLGDGHTPDGIGPVGVRPEFLGQTREERSTPSASTAAIVTPSTPGRPRSPAPRPRRDAGRPPGAPCRRGGRTGRWAPTWPCGRASAGGSRTASGGSSLTAILLACPPLGSVVRVTAPSLGSGCVVPTLPAVLPDTN